MKKTSLFVIIKCSVILYFAACTGIDKYSSTVSVTPHITNGTWKVNLFIESQYDKTSAFNGFTLQFEPNGKITATRGNDKITGNWAEDDISKKLTITLKTKDEALNKLSNNWVVSNISNTGLSFQNLKDPSGGWLQITNL
jgi:hypothetical protein